jgi:hypothetical protein
MVANQIKRRHLLGRTCVARTVSIHWKSIIVPRSTQTKTPAFAGVSSSKPGRRLALTGLETRVGFADDKDLAATADDLAVAMAGLRRLEGRKDFHGDSWERFDKEGEL